MGGGEGGDTGEYATKENKTSSTPHQLRWPLTALCSQPLGVAYPFASPHVSLNHPRARSPSALRAPAPAVLVKQPVPLLHGHPEGLYSQHDPVGPEGPGEIGGSGGSEGGGSEGGGSEGGDR